MGHKNDPEAGAYVSEKLHDEIDILLGFPASPYSTGARTLKKLICLKPS
jgi:hypothetical protein